METKKDNWKWLRVVVYILVPAIVVGWVASAVPAMMNKPDATKVAGLIGAGVGALAGLGIGLKKKFA